MGWVQLDGAKGVSINYTFSDMCASVVGGGGG